MNAKRRVAVLERQPSAVVVWTTRDAAPCPPDLPGSLLVVIRKPEAA